MKTLPFIQFGFAVLFAVLTVGFLQETDNNGGLPRLRPGQDHCTRGPGYWCYNETTQVECNKKEFCNLGRDPCTLGRTYWCTNRSTELQCNATAYCSQPPTPEYDLCNYGPEFWCENLDTAFRCGIQALVYCLKHGGIKKEDKPQNRCLWGPSYWCASVANSLRCNAFDFCEEHNWNITKSNSALHPQWPKLPKRGRTLQNRP